MRLSQFSSDLFLDLVLPCDSEISYQRALVAFGATCQRGSELSLDEGEKWLRRRSIRRSDYKYQRQSGALPPRNVRDSLPWTWVEYRILDWAKNPGSESKKIPDAVYLATLLNRTVTEVEEKILERQNIKNGIRGFDL